MSTALRTPSDKSASSHRHVSASSCLLMVIIALALRLGVAAFLYPERLNPDRDHWRFAGERGGCGPRARLFKAGASAARLHADTGPTAWMTPVYPYIVAGVFESFGIYTKTSAIVMLALDSLFSALTCIPVFLLRERALATGLHCGQGGRGHFFPTRFFSPPISFGRPL